MAEQKLTWEHFCWRFLWNGVLVLLIGYLLIYWFLEIDWLSCVLLCSIGMSCFYYVNNILLRASPTRKVSGFTVSAIVLLVHITLIIAVFTRVYTLKGIIESNTYAQQVLNVGTTRIVKDIPTCLYFSVVTFTTLKTSAK